MLHSALAYNISVVQELVHANAFGLKIKVGFLNRTELLSAGSWQFQSKGGVGRNLGLLN
jgi:hypothetical protein